MSLLIEYIAFRFTLEEEKILLPLLYIIILYIVSTAITIFAKLAQDCNIRLSEPLSSTKINKIAC